MAAATANCPHSELVLDVSSHAASVGFQRVTYERRLAATAPSGRCPSSSQPKKGGTSSSELRRADQELASAFPAPLLLPDDDLALDPKHPPQSLRSYIQETHRNKITNKRKVLYLAGPPVIMQDVHWMEDLARPATRSKISAGSKRKRAVDTSDLLSPKAADIHDYLAAFYHPLPVKDLAQPAQFVQWGKKSEQRGLGSKYVGLRLGASCTRIRVRPCPDGTFATQLNLNDILDAAIGALPDDAYAILLIVDHDIYEDEDDDFCCGRAYGGSRVSVVSSARYNPGLDDHTVDRNHMWPVSHCRAFIESMLGAKQPRQPTSRSPSQVTPMQAAVKAAAHLRDPESPSDLHGLWFSRVARTASHELGHCFGMGHCVYYACVMQSTAGIAEDCRQPPYLCAVCLKKWTRAVTEHNSGRSEEDVARDRYEALREVSSKWQHIGMFAGFEGWLSRRLQSLTP